MTESKQSKPEQCTRSDQLSLQVFAELGYAKVSSCQTKHLARLLLIEVQSCLESLVERPELLTPLPKTNITPNIDSIANIVQKNIATTASLNRQAISTLYDETKNMTSFFNLITCQEVIESAKLLMNTCHPRLGKDSVGMRIDFGSETKYNTLPHQEFPSFPYSLTGLVAWISLTETSAITGGIDVAPGSHKLGVLPLKGDMAEQQARLERGDLQFAQKASSIPEEIVSSLSFKSVESSPGDIIFMDFLTVHRTRAAPETADPRLTIQSRLYSPDDKFFKWKTANSINARIKYPLDTMVLFNEFNSDNA